MATPVVPRGVRKINEHLVQQGRALLITEDNEAQYSWEDIPYGSIKINATTGLLMGKIKGQSNWVPLNVRLDAAYDENGNLLQIDREEDGSIAVDAQGKVKVSYITDVDYAEYINNAIKYGGQTISIAKDAIVQRENFTIKNISSGNQEFRYYTETNAETIGQVTEAGFWFKLQKGHYPPGRNMLEIIIDDCLYRSAASGGIIEVDSQRFIIPEQLEPGQEISVRYYQQNRIGNPYPRIYFRKGDYTATATSDSSIFDLLTGTDDLAEPNAAEVGDLWFDYSGSVEAEDGYLGEYIETTTTVTWDKIVGYPTTLVEAQSRGMFDDASRVGHKHNLSDIDELDGLLVGGTVAYAQYADNATNAVSATNARNATQASNASLLNGQPIGTKPGNIVAIGADGKISGKLVPTSVQQIKKMADYNSFMADLSLAFNNMFKPGMIVAWYGSIMDIPSGWVLCDGKNGTPDLSDKFIMGATPTSRVRCGDIITPGLPNISAAFKIKPAMAASSGTSSGNMISGIPTGAMYRSDLGTSSSLGGSDEYIAFDASKSNSIYGSTDTVQPPAVALYYIMKQTMSDIFGNGPITTSSTYTGTFATTTSTTGTFSLSNSETGTYTLSGSDTGTFTTSSSETGTFMLSSSNTGTFNTSHSDTGMFTVSSNTFTVTINSTT